MSKLVLVGGGGHCKSVLDVALRMDIFEKVVITDPVIKPGTMINGCEVVGSDECLNKLKKLGYDYAFITVGNVRINPLRNALAKMVSDIGFEFPPIIDPTAVVSKDARINPGTFVGKKAIINVGAFIGSHCIINTGAIIEHDCVVGDFSHVSVGSVLCGEVQIGKNCMIGANSTVIQCLQVGDNCVVGAGTMLNKNLGNHCVAVGVPAKIIKQQYNDDGVK